MRALILVLAAAVVALAVSILLAPPPVEPEAPTFRPALLISDARKGEQAQYRDAEGNRVVFRVESAMAGGPDHPPSIRVRREVWDTTERLLSGVSYDHLPTIHFLFPLVAPDDPDGYDRVWVWQRIRRDEIEVGGKRRMAWRIDGIDPALEPDRDSVVAWLDYDVPVFGLLRWQRGGKTWTLDRSGSGG
jgi:hypothetical protein